MGNYGLQYLFLPTKPHTHFMILYVPDCIYTVYRPILCVCVRERETYPFMLFSKQ